VGLTAIYNVVMQGEPGLRVGGIVLCGGHSRRMGTSKSTLPFGDQTMLERMLEIVSNTLSPIVVVTAADRPPPTLPPGILLAHDSHIDAGPLAGLHAGLRALSPHVDAAFATSCDAPFLQPSLISEMVSRLGSADLAIPCDGDYHHPLAAVYRTSLADTIDRMLANGQRRPLQLLEHAVAHEVDVESLRGVDPELASFRNLNTPADYQKALSDAGLS
jgi:molybdopterin-guanine dinucleotide biosynthesis protein A